MKVVILAVGFGTRISEESYLKPKPMIEIGEKHILWHVMKEFSYYGFNEFIICAGYKQQVIKEWFNNYYLYNSDVTFDFSYNETIYHKNYAEDWKVTIVDTGLETMTGGRIKRIKPYIDNDTFFMTYGDGVSDIDIKELLKFHKKHGKIATLTAVHIGQRFGVLDIDRETYDIKAFREKSIADGSRINAGYMVLEPDVFDYIEGDKTIFEKEPLQMLSKENQLCAYKHNGFWQCMDTKREMDTLIELVEKGEAPWMKWQDKR
ncbi:MAG: glucose-1-phosphate cytidylyltransferase [Lachnospiraceae bacterium]|nr:glucose-1-phosphate cytidylyltransferase [Lachnospiraceae bacterium]